MMKGVFAMTVYNIYGSYGSGSDINYIVLSYNLKGLILNYFKFYRKSTSIKNYFRDFYFSKVKANQIATYRNCMNH